MKSLSEYTAIIEEHIKGLELPGGDLIGLYEPIHYGLAAGGKRLRPVLLLMVIDALGGDIDKGLDAALGLEMFHNFTLLHDDVMDNSDTRRGRPTVHKKWDENTAILSGDTMLTLASELMRHVDDTLLRKVSDTFDRMALDVYEGQRLDMDFETRDDVTVDEYIRMIGKKTGALIAAAAKIGALIAGADEKGADALYDYGYRLGLAFQIQDDYLDVFGDPATFGKPIGGDILNDKKTYLMLSALSSGNANAEAMRVAMQMTDKALKIKTVTRLYEQLGIKEECRRAIEKYSDSAIGALKSVALSADGLASLRKLADRLTSRSK